MQRSRTSLTEPERLTLRRLIDEALRAGGEVFRGVCRYCLNELPEPDPTSAPNVQAIQRRRKFCCDRHRKRHQELTTGRSAGQQVGSWFIPDYSRKTA